MPGAPSSVLVEYVLANLSLVRPLFQGIPREPHVRVTRRAPGRRDHQWQGQRDDWSFQRFPAV